MLGRIGLLLGCRMVAYCLIWGWRHYAADEAAIKTQLGSRDEDAENQEQVSARILNEPHRVQLGLLLSWGAIAFLFVYSYDGLSYRGTFAAMSYAGESVTKMQELVTA